MYDHNQIEQKWMKSWEKQNLFQDLARADLADKAKLFLLFAFVYPSGSGLHVGHVESKTALDILARYNRMNGQAVFFPVGWDAFGLPAENYAIKTGVPPAETTKKAINTFRRQLKRIAISYDWGGEIATSHPEYYRWTQWIFLELFKAGLAYKAPGIVNWCPSCQTVLANEQVIEGKCERCDSEVVQKQLNQWYFKITHYQDELISGLDQVDWPRATKQQQLNWIGKSEGATIHFPVLVSGKRVASDETAIDGKPVEEKLSVYTTAHDTIFGCSFMVVAPEHELLVRYKQSITNWDEVAAYIKRSAKKTELQRQIDKSKSGVKVEGLELINPFNQKRLPLYVADYVLLTYGTGAIMAVPSHDKRDYEFAKKFGLPIIPTFSKIRSADEKEFVAYADIKTDPDAYKMINSGQYDGLSYAEGREKMLQDMTHGGFGEITTQYKLRDWLISRQRYWGTPIPIVYDPEGNPHPVKEEHLPWKLPEDVDFKPTGESPLKSSKEFFERVEKLYGKGWTPEVDTMDTFVDSSWYYLRYADPRNETEFAAKDQIEKWLPVDFYMIGPEHIVLHLLYSRFFTKFLRDRGYLKFDEPFLKMRHQGMILGPDHKKMSKSKGNVITPDEIIEKFGADTLRIYEMFMGPIEADKPWDSRAVIGVYKFLNRVEKLVRASKNSSSSNQDSQVLRQLHQTIMKVGSDIQNLKFNTAVAAMMKLVNSWEIAGAGALNRQSASSFVQLLAPFAPFLAEELYQDLADLDSRQGSVHQSTWPEADLVLAREEEVTIPIQVNGRLRGELTVAAKAIEDEEKLLQMALEVEKVKHYLDGKPPKKQIYIPGKIISLVV